MCLKIKAKFVAEKDIIVYKLGYISRKSKDMYISLYRGVWISFNELYKDPLHDNPYIINEISCIFGGYLHAYTNIEKANRIIIQECLDFNVKIFKAIIPKGSVGYYGKDEDICANKIIILNSKLDSYKELPDKYRL